MATGTPMSTATEQPLNTADVRYLINQWSGRGFFRVRRFGDRMAELEVTPRRTYTIRVQTQYEERTVAPASAPYSGGPIDDRGTPPDPWDVPCERPRDFKNHTYEQPLPHTDEVRTCRRCGGAGSVGCTNCQGSGQTPCMWCNGLGYRTRTVFVPARDPVGNPTTRSEMVREPCTCIGGRVTCNFCHGRGTQGCGDCAGSGKIRTFQLLTIRFECPTLEDVLHATKVPEKLLSAAPGEVLVEERAELVERCPPVEPEVERRAAALLERSRPADPRTRRIHFQRIHVKRVQVQEVQYLYRGSQRRLWIYGDDQRIYAPGLPWPWGKLLLILTGVAGLIVFFAFVLPKLL